MEDIAFIHARNVWAIYLPGAKKEHLKEFVDQISKVTKDLIILQTLIDISGAEWDGSERRWKLWGGLGGHRKTIQRGDKELGYCHSDKWLQRHPKWEVRCLAKRYKTLYDRHGWEHATREWNQGQNWKKADAYMLSITKIQAARPGNGKKHWR